MTEFQFAAFQDDLAGALAEVADGHPVVLRSPGGPVAALVSLRDMELLEQYWEDLEDRLDLEAVREAREEIAREGTVPYELVRDIS